MSISEKDCEFVVCKNCLRTFDVDDLGRLDCTPKNRTISETPRNPKDPEGDGYIIIFESECPFCFRIGRYNTDTDVHYPSHAGSKLKDAYKAENDLLRKRVIEQDQKMAQLNNRNDRMKREKAKVVNECKRLADTVHALKTGGKLPSIPRQRRGKGKVARNALPYN